jgi:hypothetical protein
MAKGKGAGTILLAGARARAKASSSEDSGSAPDPGTSQQAATNTYAARLAASQQAARRGDINAMAQQLGMTAGPRGQRHNVNCAAFSTGQVHQFLLAHPCRGMDRLLFTIRDARGGTIAVAVAWVDFDKPAKANQLRRIDDEPGTGQINPLPGSTAGIPNVHLTGRHHRSRVVGATYVSADAEPVAAGQQTDALLDDIAGVAVLLPHMYGQIGK